MDVPKLVMAGVVGFGLYAVYRMGGAKALPMGEEPGTEGLVLLGDPLTMKKFQHYRGRLELPNPSLQPVPPFNSQGSDEDVGRALMTLGFDDLRVFSSLKELPRGWPEGTTQKISAGTRWFQGRWSQEAITLPRPGQLTHIWVIKNPNA